MEPNVDRGMWSVVALLAAIVIGGVVLLAFPKISGKIANSMDDAVSKAFKGETPEWVSNKNTEFDIEDYLVATITQPKFEVKKGSNVVHKIAELSKGSVDMYDDLGEGFEFDMIVEYSYELDHGIDPSYRFQFVNAPYSLGRPNIRKPQRAYNGKQIVPMRVIKDWKYGYIDSNGNFKESRNTKNLGMRFDDISGTIEIKSITFKNK